MVVVWPNVLVFGRGVMAASREGSADDADDGVSVADMPILSLILRIPRLRRSLGLSDQSLPNIFREVHKRKNVTPRVIYVLGNSGEFVLEIVQELVEFGANTVAVWQVSPRATWLSRLANGFLGSVSSLRVPGGCGNAAKWPLASLLQSRKRVPLRRH